MTCRVAGFHQISNHFFFNSCGMAVKKSRQTTLVCLDFFDSLMPNLLRHLAGLNFGIRAKFSRRFVNKEVGSEAATSKEECSKRAGSVMHGIYANDPSNLTDSRTRMKGGCAILRKKAPVFEIRMGAHRARMEGAGAGRRNGGVITKVFLNHGCGGTEGALDCSRLKSADSRLAEGNS
jgi:hypothetical protein